MSFESIEMLGDFRFNGIGQFFNMSGQVGTWCYRCQLNPEKKLVASLKLAIVNALTQTVFETLRNASSWSQPGDDDPVKKLERLM